MISAIAMLAAATVVTPKYDVAAYVWPAYQPEPRWAELGIFKAGKGEWQSVWEAVPKGEGHVQPLKPLWGYENEADARVVERKIDAAVRHGVNVFIYDWYWYDGRPFLEDALNRGFLGAKNSGKMKFFIMWANHHVNWLWDNTTADKRWGAPRKDWLGYVTDEEFRTKLVPRWIGQYFKRPNYYRIGGKPVFMVYETVLRRAKSWVDTNPQPGMPKLVTVNSWNEWTEGSYLEPDTVNGYGYLEAVRRVFLGAVARTYHVRE